MKHLIIVVLTALVICSSGAFAQKSSVVTTKVGETVSNTFREKIDLLLKKIEFYSDFDKAFDGVSVRAIRYNDKIKKEDLNAVKAQLNIKKYKKNIEDKFASQFTEEETDELLKIFDSPVYKKMQRCGDVLLSYISSVSEEYMTEAYKAIYEMLNKKKYEVPYFIQSAIDRLEMENKTTEINSEQQK